MHNYYFISFIYYIIIMTLCKMAIYLHLTKEKWNHMDKNGS